MLWQRCAFDLDRMYQELTLSNIGLGKDVASANVDEDRLLEVLDQHYGTMRSEAIALCEKYLGNAMSQNEKAVALLVDEFDSEAIMQYCLEKQISFVTIVPASA